MPKTFGNLKYRKRTRRNRRLTHRKRYYGGIDNTLRDSTIEDITNPLDEDVPEVVSNPIPEPNDVSNPIPKPEVVSNPIPEPNDVSEKIITQNDKNDITEQLSLSDSQVKQITETKEAEKMLGKKQTDSDKYIDDYKVERIYNPNTDVVYDIKSWVEIPEETIKFTSDELKETTEKVVTAIKEYLEKLSKMIGNQNKYIKVSYGGTGDEFIHILHTKNPIFVLKKMQPTNAE
jgi:hypothetical protein